MLSLSGNPLAESARARQAGDVQRYASLWAALPDEAA